MQTDNLTSYPLPVKLVFLDFDGVLNNSTFFEIEAMKGITEEDSRLPINSISSYNLDLVRFFIEATNSKIVISSTWRKDPYIIENCQNDEEKINEFKKLFSYFGWDNAPIIGLTPCLSGFRGQEVAAFMDNYEYPIEDYIILDDDSDFIFKFDDLSIRQQDILLRHERKNLTYWENQKLLQINRLEGFSYDNLITLLKEWAPEHTLVKEAISYEPYIKNYGKKF